MKARCKYLVVHPTKPGRIIVRTDRVYACSCPIPEMPALPASITKAYGYRPITERDKRHVATDTCAFCPLFSQATKEPTE